MSLWDIIREYNVPGFGILGVMIITLIKTWPIIQKNLLEAREAREGRYATRISELEKAVADCQERELAREDLMRKEINGLREQHLQQQLSLVRTIVDIFPNAPQLQLLLNALENSHRSVAAAAEIGNIVGDAKKHS